MKGVNYYAVPFVSCNHFMLLHTSCTYKLYKSFPFPDCSLLTSLKRFNPDEFKPKGTISNYKLGKKGLETDQVMELPLDNCIYDMIDAQEPKGITLIEVPLWTFQRGNFGVIFFFNYIC